MIGGARVVFDGEVETIEIKSGKSYLPPHQKRGYRNIIQKGYVFRFFRVDIISFKNNEFEISEKVITNSTDLKSFPIKKRIIKR